MASDVNLDAIVTYATQLPNADAAGVKNILHAMERKGPWVFTPSSATLTQEDGPRRRLTECPH